MKFLIFFIAICVVSISHASVFEDMKSKLQAVISSSVDAHDTAVAQHDLDLIAEYEAENEVEVDEDEDEVEEEDEEDDEDDEELLPENATLAK